MRISRRVSSRRSSAKREGEKRHGGAQRGMTKTEGWERHGLVSSIAPGSGGFVALGAKKKKKDTGAPQVLAPLARLVADRKKSNSAK